MLEIFEVAMIGAAFFATSIICLPSKSSGNAVSWLRELANANYCKVCGKERIN